MCLLAYSAPLDLLARFKGAASRQLREGRKEKGEMTGWGRREKAQGLGKRREGEKNRREGKGRERGWSPQLRNCIVAHVTLNIRGGVSSVT